MDAASFSYRGSHLAKGQDYQADFARIPSRQLTWKLEKVILGKIVRRFLQRSSINYLDFACGTGRIVAHLDPLVTHSTGVDISESMLSVAQTHGTCTKFIKADITRDDVLGEEKYDLITAFRFFANAEPLLREEVLGRLMQHLADDGILVFNNHRSTTFSRSRIARLITHGKRGNYGMAPREVQQLIEKHGLKIAATYHTTVVPEGEQKCFQPRWFVELLEQLAIRLPLSWLSGNLIYVCCRDLRQHQFEKSATEADQRETR